MSIGLIVPSGAWALKMSELAISAGVMPSAAAAAAAVRTASGRVTTSGTTWWIARVCEDPGGRQGGRSGLGADVGASDAVMAED